MFWVFCFAAFAIAVFGIAVVIGIRVKRRIDEEKREREFQALKRQLEAKLSSGAPSQASSSPITRN
jgi:hypothetical protein